MHVEQVLEYNQDPTYLRDQRVMRVHAARRVHADCIDSVPAVADRVRGDRDSFRR